MYMYVYMYNQLQRQGKCKQQCPKTTLFFPREKEELPRAGLEPATFCVLGRLLYQLSHRGSSAGQAESLKFVQGKWRLSPDKQGYVHVHVCVQTACIPCTVRIYMYVCMSLVLCEENSCFSAGLREGREGRCSLCPERHCLPHPVPAAVH